MKIYEPIIFLKYSASAYFDAQILWFFCLYLGWYICWYWPSNFLRKCTFSFVEKWSTRDIVMENPDLRIIMSAGYASLCCSWIHQYLHFMDSLFPGIGAVCVLVGQRPLEWEREQGQNATILTWIFEILNAKNLSRIWSLSRETVQLTLQSGID